MEEDWPGEVFLPTSEVVKKVNPSTIAVLFDDTMKLLLADVVKS